MAELLLDTTYLLPIFGVSLGLKEFKSRFDEVLGGFVVLYNPVSLIEAKWTILKGIREEPSKKGALLASYRTGLKVLESDGRLGATPLTGGEVEQTADDLHEAGMEDYFDRMIYATAAERGCALLTEDRELLRMKKSWKQKPTEVLSWNQLTAR
jgi:predicted nucleic acid-binding protein